MSRLLAPLALVILLAPALADSKADLFRAQDLERGEGDYAAALTLYRKAAETTDPAVRAEARLGCARCLRRLGKPDEARQVLEAMLAGLTPERFRRAAKAELERLPGGETEPIPPPPPDPDELKRAEREREERLRRELAGWFVSQAKAFLAEVRYDDARDRLTRALALDPGHEEARALLERLGDSPGGRERLVQEILRLLDYERELRLAELSAELDARIAAGEESLRVGDLDEAVLRLHRARGLIDAAPEFSGDLAVRRANIDQLHERAITRGGRMPSDPGPEVAPVPPAPWRSALRELLIEMASAPPGTSRLRIQDVHLPPVAPATVSGSRPFVREGRPANALDLLTRVLASGVTSGASTFVRRFGDALVVGGPDAHQEAVAAEIERINARQGRPIRLRVLAVALSPANLSLVHGVVDFRMGFGPTRTGTIDNPEQADRFTARLLSPEVGDVVARADLTLRPGGSATLSRELSLNLPGPGRNATKVEYGLRLALLAHRARDGSVRVAVDGTAARVGSLLDLPVRGQTLSIPEISRSEFSALGIVPEGGAWFEAGLANPFSRDGDGTRSTLLLIFRTLPPDDGEVKSPTPPPESGPKPVDLEGLDARPADDPSPTFRGEGARATESREAFLLRHLWDRVGEGADETTMTLSYGAVWVRNGKGLLDRTRAAVAELTAARERLVSIRVRAAVLKSSEEEGLVAGRPSVGRVLSGEGIHVARLEGEDRRRTGYVLSGVAGRYPLRRERVLARPTQLVHTVRSTRSNYLRGFFGDSKGSFPVYDSVEEGLAVEVRPMIGADGEIELRLTVRVARVLDEEVEREPVRPERPVLTVTEARIAAPAGKDSSLLITGLPAPTPVSGRRARLVLLVEAAEADMPK